MALVLYWDYGVEGKESEVDFDNAVPEFIKAIKYAASGKNIPFVSIKITGFAHFALLEKIHTGTILTADESAAWDPCTWPVSILYARLHRITVSWY